MARVPFVSRAIDEAGNAVGGSGVEARIYDDFTAATPSIVTDDTGGGTTIAQPLVPNAGTQTSLTTTTAAGDTTLVVASTAGFAVGQFIPIYDGTNTRYRFIRSILAGPPRLTIESAIGVIFSSANTSVGNPDMIGVVAGWLDDSTFHYIQAKDVASTRLLPPTLIPTKIGGASLAVQEEGAAVNTRPTMNFISPFVTATDNAGASRIDVTGPTAGVTPTASAPGDVGAEGANNTIARSDHKHAREAALVLDRNVNIADITGVTTEQTAYSFSVPGGTLGTTGMLRVTLIGTVLFNGTATLQLRIKYGASLIYDSGAISLVLGAANPGALRIEALLSAKNATNVQRSGVLFAVYNPSANPFEGTNLIHHGGGNNALAEDSTAAKTLAITFQPGNTAMTVASFAVLVEKL